MMLRKAILFLLTGLLICPYAFSDDDVVQSSYSSSVEIMAIFSMPDYVGGEFRAGSIPHFKLSAGAAFPVRWEKSYLSWALLDFYFDERNQHEYVGLGVLATRADDLHADGIIACVGYSFNVFGKLVINVMYSMNISEALFNIPINYLEHSVNGTTSQNYKGSVTVGDNLPELVGENLPVSCP